MLRTHRFDPPEAYWRYQALKALGARHQQALLAAADVESYQRLKRTLLFPGGLFEQKGDWIHTAAVSATAPPPHALPRSGRTGGSV